MTETRKKIIELIEPFMNKTRGEGCVVCVDGEYYTETKEHLDYDFSMNTVYFIIGHYDITAVLKYFVDKGEHPYINSGYIELADVYGDFVGHPDNDKIPNKPLHLYTEEEEKALLELLKKLGQTKD